jgi:hypothetical protein
MLMKGVFMPLSPELLVGQEEVDRKNAEMKRQSAEAMEKSLSSAKITDLLKEAATAHAQSGEAPESWPAFYAKYMTPKMDGRIEEPILAAVLQETKDAHTKYEKELGKPDEDWAGWYAKHIFDNIQNDWSQF